MRPTGQVVKSSVGTGCAQPARSARGPVITDDVIRNDWLYGALTL